MDFPIWREGCIGGNRSFRREWWDRGEIFYAGEGLAFGDWREGDFDEFEDVG